MRLAFYLAGASAAALAACAPPHIHHHGAGLRVASRLDCPEVVGRLERKSADADGQACLYGDKDGAVVQLQVTPLDGARANDRLATVEAGLRTELPPRPAPALTPASSPVAEDKDRVDIDLPGVHIHAGGQGADVDVAGRVQVNANESGAHVSAGGGHDDRGNVVVDANNGGAEIRVADRGPDVRQMLILASKTPGPHGYMLVGYEARGARAGPIAVATVKAVKDDRDGLYRDVSDLLERNLVP